MATPAESSRDEDLIAYADTLDSIYVEIDLHFRMLDTLNGDEITAAYKGTRAADGLVEVRNVLIRAFLGRLAGLALDRAKRSFSLRELARKLGDERTRKRCRQRFVGEPWADVVRPNGMAEADHQQLCLRMAKTERVRRADLFDQYYAEFTEACGRLGESGRTAKLKAARDKVIAHAERANREPDEPLRRMRLQEIGLVWEDLTDR